jgi:FkbM family methyltransferase
MKLLEQIKLYHRAWKYRNEDREEIRFMMDQIKKGDTVFDIGAHKGAYTFWMRKATGKNGKVFAFEPQPAGAAVLKKVFDDVIVKQMALSDRSGNIPLYIKPQAVPVSYEASLDNRYEEALVITANVSTIDILCSELKVKPTFIKIDVEGHERKVIEGGRHFIRDHHPVLLVEMEIRHTGHEAMKNLFNLLLSWNYTGTFFSGKQKLSIKDFNPQLHQANNDPANKTSYCNNFIFQYLP